jgi:hypothetical protein
MAEIPRQIVSDLIADLIAEIQASEDTPTRERLMYREGAAGELYIGVARPFPCPMDLDLTDIERRQLTQSGGALLVEWDNGVVEVALYDDNPDGWSKVVEWLDSGQID